MHDPSVDPSSADFDRGRQASVAMIADVLQAAIDSGARALPAIEAAVLLKRLIRESMEKLPASISPDEMAGRFDGTIEALAGFAWCGFLTILDMPMEPVGGVH